MADQHVPSSVVLKSRFPHATALLHDALTRALAQTGRTIAERTREEMTPGHFLDTGLSQQETVWEQLTPTSGQVHIPTDYAAYAEFGTAHTAARPVLRPAIDRTWPATMHGNWGWAMRGLSQSGRQVLPPTDTPRPPGQPVSRGQGGQP